MQEINQLVAALERKDYSEAARLIKLLQQQTPQNPWVPLYIGRFYEATNKLDEAESIYRKVLQDATNPKILGQARQGIQRLENLTKTRVKTALAKAKTTPQNSEPGLLILEPTSVKNKSIAAQKLARILQVDPYTARLKLQSNGWKLFRTGSLAELQIYGQEMLQANIPAFWLPIADLRGISIFRVQYFQAISPQATVICQNESDQQGSLTFNWSETTQRVEGLLPMFIEVMDYDPRRKTQQFRHKEMTQDYAKICDLHLPDRRSILRICDQSYQFQKGVSFTNAPSAANPPQSGTTKKGAKLDPQKLIPQTTNRMNWNHLLETLNQQSSGGKVWSEFTPFAETALDYPQLLSHLKSYVDIPRKNETLWDSAFQLYSLLAFLREQKLKS